MSISFTERRLLNDAEFLEIFLEFIVDLNADWFLVTDVGHENAAVQTLSLVEQNVSRVDVNLWLTHLLQRIHQTDTLTAHHQSDNVYWRACSCMRHSSRLSDSWLVWWSGIVVSALALINEVNLCRASLVLRWPFSGSGSGARHLQ